MTGQSEEVCSYAKGKITDLSSSPSGPWYHHVVWNGREILIVDSSGGVHTMTEGATPMLLEDRGISSPHGLAWNGDVYVMVGFDGAIAWARPSAFISFCM